MPAQGRVTSENQYGKTFFKSSGWVNASIVEVMGFFSNEIEDSRLMKLNVSLRLFLLWYSDVVSC